MSFHFGQPFFRCRNLLSERGWVRIERAATLAIGNGPYAHLTREIGDTYPLTIVSECSAQRKLAGESHIALLAAISIPKRHGVITAASD